MSSYANLYLLKKDLIAPLHAIAVEFPRTEATPSADGFLAINRGSIQAMSRVAERFWQFVDEHGEVPYKYQWSGEALEKLLFHLKRHGIDLISTKLATGNLDLEWFVLDIKAKEKYIEQLLPSNYTEEKLSEWCETEQNSATIEELIDGVKIIHAYLDLIDDSNLVLINIS